MTYTVAGKEFNTIREATEYANELENHVNMPNRFNPEKQVDTTIRGKE